MSFCIQKNRHGQCLPPQCLRHHFQKEILFKMLPVSKLSGASWRWGVKRKENLLLRLWNLNVEKLVMMSIPLAHFKLCFFLHLHSFPLYTYWRKSDGSVNREPLGNSNFRDIVANSPTISCPADSGAWRASLHDIINSFYCVKSSSLVKPTLKISFAAWLIASESSRWPIKKVMQIYPKNPSIPLNFRFMFNI